MSQRQRPFWLTAPVIPEDELQHSVYMALRVLLPGDAVITSWELRNAASVVEGTRRKRLGCRAGWPDMGVWFAGKVVLLELKRERGGVVSRVQRTLHAQLAAQGFPVCVCRSVEDALDACARMGVPVRGRISA